MKRLHLSLILAALTLLLMLVPVLAQDEGDNTLTIMHTNDVHARVLQINQFAGSCDEEAAAAGECFGGVARRATMIDAIRGEGGNSILVDAGDQFQGTLFYNRYKGEEAKQFMNALGYDAMAVGNHELDDGPSGLANFASGVDFPVLSANMDVSADADLNGLIAPYAVLDVNGDQIGIIGYTTEDTQILSSPGPDVLFTNIDTAVTAAVAELEGMGINKIVAVSHAGFGRDEALADTIDGIDVIVAGHTNTYLANDDEDASGPYPTVVNSPNGDPVLIVSANAYGKYLGRLDVTFDENGVPSVWEGEPILLDASVEEDPDILAQAMALNEPLEELRTEIIGSADVFLDGDRSSCRFAECIMGNLITDAMAWGTAAQGTEIVIQNGGGIRSSIEAGDVSVGNVLEVLPFGNLIATFGLTGADVVAALEIGVGRAENPDNEGTGRFPQVFGLRYSWDGSQPEGERIVSVEVMGEDDSYAAIDPEAVYQVASNDFMRGGGDGYSAFAENGIDAYDYGPTLDEVVVEYIAAMSPVAPALEGRITRVDEVMAAEAADEGEGEEAVAGEGAMAEIGDIVDTAVAAGSFTTLAAALDAAGLVETLKGEGPFTVFAPTDDAFAALPDGTIEGLLEDPQGALTDILLYHVVSGKVMAADVVGLDGQEVETVGGGKLLVTAGDDGSVMINEAMVVTPDVEASNGVIHVIDSVLIPPADEEAVAEGEMAEGDKAVAEGEMAEGDKAMAEGEMAEGDKAMAEGEMAEGEEATAEGEMAEGEEATAEGEMAEGEDTAVEAMAPETLPVTGSAPATMPTLVLVLLVIAVLFGSDIVRRRHSA